MMDEFYLQAINPSIPASALTFEGGQVMVWVDDTKLIVSAKADNELLARQMVAKYMRFCDTIERILPRIPKKERLGFVLNFFETHL